MKKPVITLYILIILIILALGGLFFFYSLPKPDPAQTFPAMINRDCAPWDGAAFTVAVQYDPTTVIYISIWKSPDIKFPITFVVPDDEGQVGNAYILPELGPYTVLNGEVFLQGVSVEEPVEGRFSFTSERGDAFQGQFSAEWENKVVYCG